MLKRTRPTVVIPPGDASVLSLLARARVSGFRDGHEIESLVDRLTHRVAVRAARMIIQGDGEFPRCVGPLDCAYHMAARYMSWARDRARRNAGVAPDASSRELWLASLEPGDYVKVRDRLHKCLGTYSVVGVTDQHISLFGRRKARRSTGRLVGWDGLWIWPTDVER